MRPPASGGRRERGGRWCAFVLACLGGCADDPVAATARQRHGRLGSLRDLVLFERPGLSPAQSLFVDRFEVTRADWAEFAATAAGRALDADAVAVGGDGALPVAGIDLLQARAFATWRCLRLPTRAEWTLVATGNGRSRFPWGDDQNGSRANTGELGLLSATPVGTFESGRRTGGEQPYDLIGNVSEWTETVPTRWFQDELDSIAAQPRVRDGLLASRATSVWSTAPGVFPSMWLVEPGGATVPREVVGADFQSPMDVLVEAVPGGDRRQRTGVRLYGTATDVVAGLGALTDEPTIAEVGQLRDFVLRTGHREVLAFALVLAVPAKPTPFTLLLAQLTGVNVELPR